ncbi:valine--tRNA ligase [Ferruginivarius sediminum]|uniref:Valine--tRNA ligase n=1 Tax=Ferruginivarius sediminum TaxID=2661937 RepID=A0A369TF80_9PROT|nr:valine--tRNA ligase [Ferruginivarius sediminum]RDD63910.1 valine--tRNA ligase [Ferruginivarius sediminum]
MLDKTYRPAEVEAKFYDIWRQDGAFACHPDSAARPYTIMMPPPNVTGSLHMGHALTFTLQDVLIRYKRMQGRDALWQPGMDHAGIATQMVVERNLAAEGISRYDLGRPGFLEKVWQWKAESGGAISRQLTNLGASPDWARERFTMDDGLSKAVRKTFVDLYRQGLIYRDQRLVNWDPKLHTAISDLEVEQVEVNGKLWHFKYPVEGENGVFITVATTRPETMLGDTGVAVHPEDERYTHLVGKHVILPLVGRRIPIVADEWADPETGSGAVKITPAHDFNDFEVGRRRGLETVNILDRNARLNDNVPEAYRGLDRYEARKRVVADLEAQGLVAEIEDHVHMVPHGDRSGVAIEPWLTDQWYVDAKTLAKPAIEAVEQGRTRFVPQQWENVYFEWMRNIQPWCISRQIWWGHQIPAWYGRDGDIFVETTEEAARTEAEAHYGVAVETLGAEEEASADQAARVAEGKLVLLRRDEDVLDTWFSSGLWPFSTLGWPDETPELRRYYPTDVLVTGFDIIFFWVARMMMMGLHFMDEVPFHTVYIHALVRDAKGQKMSKSKGNVIDPLDLIERFGADALRFTLVALSAQGRDIKMSEQRVEGYRNFATKLWNAARFCLMNEVAPDPAFDPRAVKQTLNRWAIAKTVRAGLAVDAALEAYRFNDAAGALYQFTWHQFCDWYVEFAKPILQSGDDESRAETRATIAWVMQRLLHLLHPFMPFVTEELWEQFGGGEGDRLITGTWPAFGDDLLDEAAEAEIDWVSRVVGEIRTVRGEMNVPSNAEAPLLLKGANAETRRRLDAHAPLIKRLARLESVDLTDAAVPHGAAQFLLDEATAILPLQGIIDIDQEQQRLQKEIEKLESDLSKYDKKLSNEQFLNKAPAEVVEEQRQRRADAAAARDKLAHALDRLAG